MIQVRDLSDRPAYGLVPEMGPQWVIRMYLHPQRTKLCASLEVSRSKAFIKTLAQSQF